MQTWIQATLCFNSVGTQVIGNTGISNHMRMYLLASARITKITIMNGLMPMVM